MRSSGKNNETITYYKKLEKYKQKLNQRLVNIVVRIDKQFKNFDRNTIMVEKIENYLHENNLFISNNKSIIKNIKSDNADKIKKVEKKVVSERDRLARTTNNKKLM